MTEVRTIGRGRLARFGSRVRNKGSVESDEILDAQWTGARGRDHVLLTAPEVATLLGVPLSWVREQSRRGRIPTVALGRYRRYRLEAIESWIEELEGCERTSPARSSRAGLGRGRQRSERA
jgi:excisionase family DNA binding protein